MDVISVLMSLCVLNLLEVSCVDYDCPYRYCECFMGRIVCDNLGLESLPPLTTTQPTVNTYLSANENEITEIPAGSLPTALEDISLLNNPIEIIDDAAFVQSSTTLMSLSFSAATFTRIPDAFLQLKALKYLSIENSNIIDWNVDAVKHIGPNIETLYLANVGLKTWPTWLQYFPRVTELSIFGSSISYIADDALDNMSNSLMTLTLIGNGLTVVPKAISKLTVLQTLNLIDTKIFNVTWLPSSGIISMLAIENGSLSDADHVSNALRPLGKSLVSIRLKENQLIKIPDLSFITSPDSVVDLTHNQISDPFSVSLPADLQEIDLASNFLPNIPAVFSSLKRMTILSLPGNNIAILRGSDFPPSVTEVDLGNNMITELADASFPQNSKIQSLILSNNPIFKISANVFKNLPALQMLEMQNTKITRLPLGLASLSNLNNADISGDSSLVCTCAEIGLRPLILRLESLKGNCGAISIYFFFGTLGLSCPT